MHKIPDSQMSTYLLKSYILGGICTPNTSKYSIKTVNDIVSFNTQKLCINERLCIPNDQTKTYKYILILNCYDLINAQPARRLNI